MKKKKNSNPEPHRSNGVQAPTTEAPRAAGRALSAAPVAPKAAKAPKAKAPKAAKPAAPKRVVVIDYPMEGEIVTSAHYAFRLGASETDRVEVSIDGKEWLACRPNSGYWWFDWSGYNAGPHSIVARIPAAGNKFTKSKLRQLTVLI